MTSEEATRALLERIRQIPLVGMLNMEIKDFSEGFCEVRVGIRKDYEGIYESFAGGLLATVADSVACFAVMTLSGPDARLTTTDLNIRFLSPCLTGVTGRARVIKYGKTLCPVAVDLFDDEQKLVAVSQVTYIMLDNLPVRDHISKGR